MPGLDAKRLVLVTWTTAGPGGPTAEHVAGTGYFIAADLVLTASHVAPEDPDISVAVRVEEGIPRWREGGRVVWRDDQLDAAIIRVGPLDPSVTSAVVWRETALAKDVTWTSTGYPDASTSDEGGERLARKSAGLDGTLYAHGGGGQGPRELDLGVNSPPPPEGWAGVSGAPIFVDDELVGIVKSVPTGFGGNRLAGVPAAALMQSPGFRLTVAARWLEFPPSGPWLLVLLSESAPAPLGPTIEASVERHGEALTKAAGAPLHERIFEVRILDALQTPEHWLQLVKALCAAPIMVADVTGFEPAMMLALGVRAVVRRGVTVASTANRLDESVLSQLLFNIQEMKLISHGDEDAGIDADHPRFSLNIIASAIVDGLRELAANPRYLDLPAYDAVRCPPPELPSERQRAREPVLVLCSFHKEYAAHWHHLSVALAKKYPAKQIVRMLDIASPRLVGLALYEHVRWANTCVVDWTHWRPNVFFELGVRLACSGLQPVGLLDEADDTAPLAQKQALERLFRPARYALAKLTPTMHEALRTHEALTAGETRPQPMTEVPPNSTYEVALDAFDWKRERVTLSPGDLLRASAEGDLGKDPQKSGATPVLFCSNPAFSRELWKSVRERWIAAWYYTRHRYPQDALRDNAELRAEVKRLGESLLQWVRDDPEDPSIATLRESVVELLDALEE